MTTPFLEIQQVGKRFGDTTVLRGVDLTISEGTVTTLIGKSGSGKTVLLKCIAGLLTPDEGVIRFQGEAISGPGALTNPRWKEAMSYLFQGDALFDSLTAWENVAMPLREGSRLSRTEIDDRVKRLFSQLDLKDIETKFPGELSGGMRRRVALARALVTAPKMVLFDEPTTGLDPVRRNAVLERIRRDRDEFGFTALVVSHDVPASLFISDQLAILERGSIAYAGPPEDLGTYWETPGNEVLCAFIENETELILETAGLGSRVDLEGDFQSLTSRFDTLTQIDLPTTNNSGVLEELALPRLLTRLSKTFPSETCSRLYGLGRRQTIIACNGGMGNAIAKNADFSCQYRETPLTQANSLREHLHLLATSAPQHHLHPLHSQANPHHA